MYFPHLFARRAELLALRDLCENLDLSETVAPILEPVKANSSDLLTCMRVLGENNAQACIIVNPMVADFGNQSLVEPWRATLEGRFEEFETLLPTFVCRASTTAGAVTQFLNRYPERDVVLAYLSPMLSTAQIAGFVEQDRIRFHLNLQNQMSTANRGLLPTSKAVDIIDHFNRLPRNADYVGQEFFSDDHQTYEADSCGFGDYSVIGSRHIPGGGPAHAVAIHAVYQTDAGELWVEHFVSDDVDAEAGTVEGKYLQAATKLVEAAEVRDDEFGDDAAIQAYEDDVENDSFPGLTTNKRRQIYHHLALVESILSEA